MSASSLNLIPPFTRRSAILKVRKAEDSWNSRNPHQVSLGYTPDSVWRNRSEFINGREEIVAFLIADGSANSITGSSRNFGRSIAIESQFDLRMSSMMIRGNGSARMETRIGSLMLMGSRIADTQASTMCR